MLPSICPRFEAGVCGIVSMVLVLCRPPRPRAELISAVAFSVEFAAGRAVLSPEA